MSTTIEPASIRAETVQLLASWGYSAHVFDAGVAEGVSVDGASPAFFADCLDEESALPAFRASTATEALARLLVAMDRVRQVRRLGIAI